MNNYQLKRDSSYRFLLVTVLLAVVALTIYSNTLDAPFVFDDLPNITQSPHIRMTELTLDKLITGTRPAPFRPVAYLSFAFNYYFSRYDTIGYHLTNITIHVVIAILLFLISGHTLRLTGIARGIIPETASLVWLVHPLHTQSVTYTVQRINSLATLFFMLSLYLYLRARLARRDNQMRRLKTGFLFSGCLIAGLLALFSKQIAATLPICILLYEWFFFQNMDKAWLKKQARWIVLVSAVFLTIATLYLKADPVDKILSAYATKSFTLGQRLLTEPRVVIYYLSLLFFPHPSRLNIDYDFPLSASLTDPAATALSLLAIVALLGAALYRPGRHRLLSFAILWFLVNLAIESSVIGLAIIFEHRTYLPSLFPAFIVTACLIKHLPRRFSFIVLALLVIVSGAWTYQRNAVWNDDLFLWQDCAKKSPRDARPANGVGVAYQTRHEPEKALEWFQKSVRLDPDYDEPHSNIGGILINLGHPAEAVPHLERAVALDPENIVAISNLGSAMNRLNRLDDAIMYYQKAIGIFPDYEIAHNNLGAALIEKGDIEGAARHLNRAVRINPEYADAYNNLGLVMTRLGRIQEAIACYQQALRLAPEDALVHYNLGVAWFEKQNLDRAREQLQQAVRFDSQPVAALDKLATVFVMQRQYPEAAETLSRLAGLRPDIPTVYYNLACVYALQNEKEKAVASLEEAVNRGYNRWDHLRNDKDLENISDTSYYKSLIKK